MTDNEPTRMQRDHDAIYGHSRKPPSFNADWVADRVLAGRNCLSELDVDLLATQYGVTHRSISANPRNGRHRTSARTPSTVLRRAVSSG